MRPVLRRGLFTLALMLAWAGSANAQTMFLVGQNVQPIFEGWQQNPDGTFSFLFGYLNRNYEEEPFIAVGANNTFEPAPADRGQPTYFYARRQQFVFAVTVPAEALTGRLTPETLALATGFAIALLAFTRWWWRFGLTRYSGASA